MLLISADHSVQVDLSMELNIGISHLEYTKSQRCYSIWVAGGLEEVQRVCKSSSMANARVS